MDRLIESIFDIIKDYREEEDDEFMTTEILTEWIHQFNEEDRIFLLEELLNILTKRYISKDKAIHLLKCLILHLTKKYEYNEVKDFLLDSYFFHLQPATKSQTILLNFLDEIISTEYDVKLSDCNKESAKYYIYIDDVLCTGDSLFKGLANNSDEHKGWFFKKGSDDKNNLEHFIENQRIIILGYFAIHTLNLDKVRKRINIVLKNPGFDIFCISGRDYRIENDITDSQSKLNFVFPKISLRNEKIINCETQITEKIHSKGYHTNEVVKYRENEKPEEETFFSSSENRDRFEKIILDKSIDIYNSSNTLKENLRAKPLGYGLTSDLSLGYGTLIFTWRNVPFNTPLVFWYESSYWKPLFKRNFTEY